MFFILFNPNEKTLKPAGQIKWATNRQAVCCPPLVLGLSLHYCHVIVVRTSRCTACFSHASSFPLDYSLGCSLLWAVCYIPLGSILRFWRGDPLTLDHPWAHNAFLVLCWHEECWLSKWLNWFLEREALNKLISSLHTNNWAIISNVFFSKF